jgi:DNA repair protein RadC
MTEPNSARVFRIQDLPVDERPRERLARLGPAALSSEELLALLLVSGSRGESALDRARRVLATHGGLSGLAALSGAELSRERGIKGARAAAIAAALEIGRRLAAETLAGRDLFNEPALVKDYLRRARGEGTQERTGALYLNARNRLLRDDPEIYRGTLDRAVVEPREILKRALLANAAGSSCTTTTPPATRRRRARTASSPAVWRRPPSRWACACWITSWSAPAGASRSGRPG